MTTFPHLTGAATELVVGNASLSLPPRDFEARWPVGLVPAGRLPNFAALALPGRALGGNLTLR